MQVHGEFADLTRIAEDRLKQVLRKT